MKLKKKDLKGNFKVKVKKGSLPKDNCMGGWCCQHGWRCQEFYPEGCHVHYYFNEDYEMKFLKGGDPIASTR